MASHQIPQDIRLAHQRLFDDLSRRMDLLRDNKAERDAFIGQVSDFIAKARDSVDLTNMANFYWLTDTVSTWQLLISGVLGVSKSFDVISPPKTFYNLGVQGDLINDESIRRTLNEISYYLSESRRGERRKRLLMDIFGIDIRSTPDESDRDWLHAEEYFAFDILRGELDLCTFAVPSVFSALSRVWLRDVVQLKAYDIWKDQKGRRYPSQLSEMQNDYKEALQWFYKRASSANKCTHIAGAANALIGYLSSEYLEDGSHRIRKGGAMYNSLVRRKAHRCWEMSGERDEGKNWRYAEYFVKMFYDNVFSAILAEAESSRKEARQKMIEAIKMSEDKATVVDCFEASIIVYFIDDIVIAG